MAHEHTGEDCLSLVTIFQSLPEKDLAIVADIVSAHHFKAGEFLYQAGDEANALMIVAHGQAKVYQIAANGKEQMLRILQTGEFDGEAALFSNSERTSFAEALMDTDVCQISRGDFQKLMKSSPELAVNMVNAFGQRITQLEQQTTEVTTASVESRLANYLLETSAGLDDARFTLPLKKKDIATYLGTTPETISRKLTKMASDNLLENKGLQVKILDSDGLAMLV
ncbi:Crp/Fnr family transcriptional regulator [Lactobacillus salsicarnum]|uniref:Crp/Fnr family transcriptional regulator n=1 Tax=Companilactobacillus mishanensis TaxID=2486008 RepID=A0A5P0ZJ20_9LACO|nr:Crp/Fnr family transcriptional regulator [Companilactobacillus mishanensis]MQS53093.1 Crp/Fnr family transcriptional regulator [Companilactobacillus mishanensis]MQS89748.1 Crp/Fnr family transcriptional regulator [Companilactobacillus mishanensis]